MESVVKRGYIDERLADLQAQRKEIVYKLTVIENRIHKTNLEGKRVLRSSEELLSDSELMSYLLKEKMEKAYHLLWELIELLNFIELYE